MVGGKEALSALNRALQEKHGISVTATSIIDAMRLSEVPDELRALLGRLDAFRASSATGLAVSVSNGIAAA